jgi:hypothetical protein
VAYVIEAFLKAIAEIIGKTYVSYPVLTWFSATLLIKFIKVFTTHFPVEQDKLDQTEEG